MQLMQRQLLSVHFCQLHLLSTFLAFIVFVSAYVARIALDTDAAKLSKLCKPLYNMTKITYELHHRPVNIVNNNMTLW